MKPEIPPKTSNRRFSKSVLVINLALIWILMFFGVIYAQAQWVVPSGLALIGLMFGVYTGVGHLDFRKVIELSANQLFRTEVSITETSVKTTSDTDGETG